MIHEEVFKIFINYFPQYDRSIVSWFSNGKNSIRIRLHDFSEFVFTFNGKKDWYFETVDSHIRRMKGAK